MRALSAKSAELIIKKWSTPRQASHVRTFALDADLEAETIMIIEIRSAVSKTPDFNMTCGR